MARCLILGCSRKKLAGAELMPAINRYDGPLYRVTRKFLRERPDEGANLEIFVLSAALGLVPSQMPIPYYDQRMTAKRAHELRPIVLRQLSHVVTSQSFGELYLCVGRGYQEALTGWETIILDHAVVTIATGSLGKRQSDLQYWLHCGEAHPTWSPRGHSRLREKELLLTPQEIISAARRALAEGGGNPFNYQAWYVPVDECRVSVKWLVSQLTDLPVNAFTTGQARRVLAELGVDVRRQ